MNRLFAFDFLKWFYPGMHIKRWLGLIIIGVAMMTFGLSYVVREAVPRRACACPASCTT